MNQDPAQRPVMVHSADLRLAAGCPGYPVHPAGVAERQS
jgi:hypothetical protein